MLAAQRVRLTAEDEYVARYLSRESPQVRKCGVFTQAVDENSLHILVSLKTPSMRRSLPV